MELFRITTIKRSRRVCKLWLRTCVSHGSTKQRVQCNDGLNQHQLLIWDRDEVAKGLKVLPGAVKMTLPQAMQSTRTRLHTMLRFGPGMYAEMCCTISLFVRNTDDFRILKRLQHLCYDPNDIHNHVFCAFYYCFTGDFYSILQVIQTYYHMNQRAAKADKYQTLLRLTWFIGRLRSTPVGTLHEATRRCATMLAWTRKTRDMPADFDAFVTRLKPTLDHFGFRSTRSNHRSIY